MPSEEVQVPLRPEELALLRELLERERGDLPAEIRHTRTAPMHEDLQRRLRVVEGLLQRFEAVHFQSAAS